MTNDTIGVDISKDHLDAHRMSDGKGRRFANDKAGHGAFLNWVGQPGTRIVYEPTGPYHRAFERRLAAVGLSLVKVNPRQARRFAEATGRLAKTDRLDAAMLARMGALLELEARPVRSPVLNTLKDLHMAREALVKNRTATKNRAKNLTLPILKRHNAEQLRQIKRQIAAIETEIMVLIEADPDLFRRFGILVSIPGVSAITAFALIIDMPELGSIENGQAASLAGLAPVARQSGQWTGRAFIRGGRANVRQALYMPALVAIRFNPDIKAKYQQLKAAGKASKVAITAIMRKLIVMANALLRDRRKWTQSLP
jgi:transposase